jgi:hypothetical protein
MCGSDVADPSGKRSGGPSFTFEFDSGNTEGMGSRIDPITDAVNAATADQIAASPRKSRRDACG